MLGKYEIREYRPGDETSLLATFNLVFGEKAADFQPRSLAEWQWAFLKNPAGLRIFVALCEGEVVAQCAGLPLRMLVGGKPQVFTQPVDSCVHPAHRAGLKRPGLFVETALAFFDHYNRPDRDLVHYGLPIEEAYRIGKAFLGYEVVRQQNVLVRQLPAGATELPEGVEELTRFDHQARWLYDRCCGAWGASAIRDDAFWNWRFLEHPRWRYRALGVRDSAGLLRGVAIWRASHWLGSPLGLLCDWLVPPEEPQVAQRLVAGLAAVTRAQGLALLAGIFPEWSPWHLDFQERGFLVQPSEYFMNCRQVHPRFDALWLRDHWWYQLADTDLC